MGDDCASVGTSCQESILLLGVGVPKDECFVSKGIAKRGWKEEESQIGAKDKMIVYQHDVSV